MMKRMLVVVCCLLGAGVMLSSVGCTPNTEPIERATNTIIVEVVKPLVTKAVEETKSRSFAAQGGAQVIEPGWEMVFEGYVVSGVKGTLSVRAKGVAGQVQASTQGDQGPDLQGAPGTRPAE